MQKINALKKILANYIFLFILTSSLTAQENDCDYPLRQLYSLNHPSETYRGNGFAENYDLKYHRLSWFVNPNEYYITGEVMSLFKAVNDSIDFLEFELTHNLTVDSVIFHGEKIAFLHKTSGILRVTLPVFIRKNQLDSISVFYHGQPENNGSGSFVKDIHNSNIPIIWTLSQPYGSRDWWPCKHSLNDKIDSVDIFIKTLKGNLAASNGILVSENEDSLYYYCHWKHRYPIAAYLVAIAVTNYTRFSDWVFYDNKSLEILNYIYPESVAGFRSNIQHTIDVMQFYIEKFGFYPFDKEKYGHAQFGRNGGMEHQTMSFMGHFSEMLVAHELAHQWFGDYITCNSWQDIWLNESFATFCDGLVTQRFQTPQTYLNLLRDRISSITSQPGGSVFVPAGDTMSVNRVFNYRLSYQKGAMVLNMLRFMLGESAFFTAVRNYLNDPSLRFSYARTDDLRKHFEQVSGQDLSSFFQNWIYGEGFPSYKITYYPVKNHLTIMIEQFTSHPSVSFFSNPVPLLAKGLYQDSLLVLYPQYNSQIFDIDLAFQADTLIFDPYYHIISASNLLIKKNIPFEEGTKFIVMPNPISETFEIQFLEQLYIKNITLTDLSGRVIYDSGDLGKIVEPGEKKQVSLAGFNLKPGFYLLKITNNFNYSVKRLYVLPDKP